MSEDLIIKYLEDYKKCIFNMFLTKKLHLDKTSLRFTGVILIIILFIISCVFNIIGVLFLSKIFFISFILVLIFNIITWTYIDFYKMYKLKKLCDRLNMSNVEVVKLIRKYKL